MHRSLKFALLASIATVATSGLTLAQQAKPAPKPAAVVAPAPTPTPTPTPTPAAAATPDAAQPDAPIVTGFRSAKFGAAEADVVAAITADFGIAKEKIRREDNPAELTHALIITVPDLLEGGGTADVAYVFGYKTKTLIQIGLTWSKATDDKMTPERLFSNANILRAHFLGAGYQPESIATNAVVNGGLMMFRGNDSKEHTTVLVLQGAFRAGEGNQRVLTPSGLVVYYIADSKSPDIFKLPTGTF